MFGAKSEIILVLIPVAVIFEFVVASKCDESSKANSKWPVNLSGSINPYLQYEIIKFHETLSAQ